MGHQQQQQTTTNKPNSITNEAARIKRTAISLSLYFCVVCVINERGMGGLFESAFVFFWRVSVCVCFSYFSFLFFPGQMYKMICPFTRFDYSNGQVRRSLLIKNSSKVNVLARREEIGKEELGNIEIKIPKGTKKKEKKKRGSPNIRI